MISKAILYTEDQNAHFSGSKLIVVCEVALGDSKEVTRHNNNFKFEEGIQSI